MIAVEIITSCPHRPPSNLGPGLPDPPIGLVVLPRQHQHLIPDHFEVGSRHILCGFHNECDLIPTATQFMRNTGIQGDGPDRRQTSERSLEQARINLIDRLKRLQLSSCQGELPDDLAVKFNPEISIQNHRHSHLRLSKKIHDSMRRDKNSV